MDRLGTYKVLYSQGSALYAGLAEDDAQIVKHEVEGLSVLQIVQRPRILSLQTQLIRSLGTADYITLQAYGGLSDQLSYSCLFDNKIVQGQLDLTLSQI